jgi:hypothetical protein
MKPSERIASKIVRPRNATIVHPPGIQDAREVEVGAAIGSVASWVTVGDYACRTRQPKGANFEWSDGKMVFDSCFMPRCGRE